MLFPSRLLPLLVMPVLLCGCFGKLLFGETRTDGGVCNAADDGGASEAFVGTWTCTIHATGYQEEPGSTVEPRTSTQLLSITENEGGTLSMDYTCPSLSFVISGDTATLNGTQTCFVEVDQITLTVKSGTFTVSRCGATLSDFVVIIPPLGEAPANQTDVDTETGTCTKN